jgi:hypothetical protein
MGWDGFFNKFVKSQKERVEKPADFPEENSIPVYLI